MASNLAVAPVLPTWVFTKILFFKSNEGGVVAVTDKHTDAWDAAVAPGIVPCITTVLWYTLTSPAPPPKIIPLQKSPEVPLDATPDIILFAIKLVPDIVLPKTIPAAE